jgi:hypothetical protein
MIPIALSEMGPLDPKDPLPLGGPASRALDRIPPAALLLLAIVSIQLSAAFATFLFASLGPAGTAFLTVAFSSGVLTLLSPPRIDRRLRDGAIPIALFGLATACLALPFFLALQRIPLGIASAIGFLGPLGVAVATSHRLSHFLVIGVAALGVGLLTPEAGSALDPYGLALAALSALGWAAIVPFSKWAGRAFSGNDGLTFSFWITSFLLLPFALTEGSMVRGHRPRCRRRPARRASQRRAPGGAGVPCSATHVRAQLWRAGNLGARHRRAGGRASASPGHRPAHVGGDCLRHPRCARHHAHRPEQDPVSLAGPASAAARQPLHQLLPLYVVVFMGFIGYSLMITVFTPMLLRSDRAMLPASTMLSTRTILLGLLLCLYPLGQFIGSPILGSLSDRFGRRPILLISLGATTACYVLISLAITINAWRCSPSPP